MYVRKSQNCFEPFCKTIELSVAKKKDAERVGAGCARRSKRMGRVKKHDRNGNCRQRSSRSSESDSYGRRTRSRSRDRRSSRSRSRGRRSTRSRSRGRRSSRSLSRNRRYSRSKSQDRRYSRSRSRSYGRRGSRNNGKRRSRERSQSYLWRNRDRSKSRSDERIGRDKHDKRSSRHGHSKLRGRSSQEKMKDTMKEIEMVKSRMRSALESAQMKMSDSIEARGSSESYLTDLTVAETVARHRDIELIEEEGFHQSVFISSAGGAGGRVRKEDVTDRAAMVTKKEDEHDKAMFGPKWRDAEKRYNDDKKETIADVEVDKEIPLANARFYEDKTIREERWLKIYRERRAKLLVIAVKLVTN
ncbi:Zinc finger protein [Dirofilaria immitis]